MSFTMQVNIECGKTTCAKEPGEFCAYVGVGGFGTRWYCTYPWTPGNSEPVLLHEKDGWIERCKACLKKEAEVQASLGLSGQTPE